MSIPADPRERAMGLDAEDREMLMHDLWGSLKPDDGWWEAWGEEIERRCREVEEGRVELVPWEVVRARMLEAIEQSRRP